MEARTVVDLYVYKLQRKVSLTVHTGLLILDPTTNEAYQHDVRKMAGSAPETISVPDLDAFWKDVSDKVKAASLSVPSANVLEYLTEHVLPATWRYDLLSSNCRDHCLRVLQDLRLGGVEVSPQAFEFLGNTKRNDAVIVLGGLALGCLCGPRGVMTGLQMLSTSTSLPIDVNKDGFIEDNGGWKKP